MAFRKISLSVDFSDPVSRPFLTAGLPYTTRTRRHRDEGFFQMEDKSNHLEQLAAIVGAEGVGRDGTGHLILSPGSVDELKALVTSAADLSIILNLGPHAGSDAPGLGARVGLQRLNRIIEVDPENLTARVEAGVLHTTLSDAFAEFGLLWPVTPLPGHETLADSVLSGLALGNSGLFPDLRRWILGSTLVARDGLRFNAGGRTIKNSSGYDLTRAAIGATGLFGIPAELQLRLERRPALARVAHIPLEDAGATTAILALATANLELISRLSFASTSTHPLTARLALGGRDEAVHPLWSLVEAGYPQTDAGAESPALATCASADSLLGWNAGPATCLRIAGELSRLGQPVAGLVALPLQRRGFVTGADPARISEIITSSGGTPILLPDGFTGFSASELLAPATRPFAAAPPQS